MNRALTHLYHTLPAPLRTVAASAYGWALSRRRYGAATERLVADALARERWTAAEWHSWVAARLRTVLRAAATRVPHYRSYWAQSTCSLPDAAALDPAGPWDDLENWPVLKKCHLRASPDSFLARDSGHRWLIKKQTSGSTGTPIALQFTSEADRAWYALGEARWRRWYGVSRQDRWAILGGQLVVPITQRRAPFWVWNAGLRQLYMSSYHLSPENIPAFLDALRQYHVVFLLGYSSALHAVASVALERELAIPMMKAVLSNAEPLLAGQRETIQRAFQCQVRETYGMTEAVCGASECEAGRLHIWPEAGVCEVLSDHGDHPAKPGEAGRLVCTGLLNSAMPLIRYEVGDRVALSEAESCPCGRALPWLHSIEGRSDDVVITSDGRRVGRLDPVFKADLPIREAQIIQESVRSFRVRLVVSSGFGPQHEAAIQAALADRIGDIDVVFEHVEAIPRGPNGKFRSVVRNF